jgi:hypothetical protein
MPIRRGPGLRHGIYVYEYTYVYVCIHVCIRTRTHIHHTCDTAELYLKAHVLRRARGTSTKALLRLFQGAIKALSQGAINGTCDTAKLYLKAHVLRLARGVLKRLPNHLPLACLPRPLCMPHHEAPRNRAVVKGS